MKFKIFHKKFYVGQFLNLENIEIIDKNFSIFDILSYLEKLI